MMAARKEKAYSQAPTHRDNQGEGKRARTRHPFCRRHLGNDRPTITVTVPDPESGTVAIDLCEPCNTPAWIAWYVQNRVRLYEQQKNRQALARMRAPSTPGA